jgi:hypothetical protein
MSDIFNQLNNMGFGRGKQDNASDGTNEKNIVDALVVDPSGKTLYSGAKLAGVPVNLSNVFEVGLQKAVGGDSEGITGKMIMPSFDSHGGFFAKLFHAVFVKNREITDHTAGVGGDASGSGSDGGGSSSSGGGDFGDGGSFSDYSSASLGSFVSPSSFPDYDFIPISAADLGNFSPPVVGTGQSAGMELG